jgi:hypothetical protein
VLRACTQGVGEHSFTREFSDGFFAQSSSNSAFPAVAAAISAAIARYSAPVEQTEADLVHATDSVIGELSRASDYAEVKAE